MKQRYYVNGEQINEADWEIEWYKYIKIEEYDEHFKDDEEYITDRHGKQLGVGWKV